MKASVSTLANFASCRRAFWWDQTYRTLVPAKALWIGQVVHAGLDHYYRSGRDTEKALEGTRSYIEQEISRYQKELPPFLDIEGELIPPAEEALAYVQNYGLFDATDPFDGTVVDVERGFRLPLTNSEDVVSGRIDLVMRSNKTGRLIVVDHKTMGSKPSLSGLDVDLQMTAYAWAVWQIYGEIPERIVYNCIIKGLPSEPAVLKGGKLSKDRSMPVVHDLYLAKIRELGLNETDYSDILDYLAEAGWSRFFSRVESQRNRSELLEFEKFSAVKIREIQRILDDPENEAYPSPSAFSCSYCSYLGACKIKSEGGDWKSVLEDKFAKW